MNQKDFGKYFAFLRKKSGFNSQRKLAKAAGLNHGTISRIEDGSQKAKPETLKILSNFLIDASYGELLKKAGYFDELPYSDQEAQVEKSDYFDIIETINESYIRRMMKEDDKFLDLIQKEVNNTLKTLIKENKPITPQYLIKLNKNSTDTELKLELNKKLFEIIQSNNLQGNTYLNDKEKEDFNFTKEMNNILDRHSAQDDLFSTIDYINDSKISRNDFEIVDSRILKERPGFAYKVTDGSMKNDGIYEGDILICVKVSNLSPSDIGIILDESGEPLLRKVQFYENFLILTSSEHEPEVVIPNSVRIVGKVIQSQRRYE